MTDNLQDTNQPASPSPAGDTQSAPPAASGQEQTNREEESAPSVQSAASSGGPGRVLLIEDDPPMVKMYSTKLNLEGFEVEVAYDGEEGLKKIVSWGPDLVVLDLMIPKIGGMELLEKLRSETKTKDIPVVILSNLSQEQDIQRAKELKVKDFLVKANYTPGQVVEKIRQALGR